MSSRRDTGQTLPMAQIASVRNLRKKEDFQPMPRTLLRVVVCYLLLTCAFAACAGKAHTQADCDAIADDIRTAAARRNLDTRGICNSTNATIQQDFGKACADLKACQDDCCR